MARVGQAFAAFFSFRGRYGRWTTLQAAFVLRLLVLASVCWFIVSSLFIYPHEISYFNESIGGPLNGPRHLLGSNVDWGQDLCYLGWSMGDNADSHRVHLAYFGLFNPADVGFGETLPWPRCDTTSDAKNRKSAHTDPVRKESGDYAISVNLLYGYPRAARDSDTYEHTLDPAELAHFRKTSPTSRVGYSIQRYTRP